MTEEEWIKKNIPLKDNGEKIISFNFVLYTLNMQIDGGVISKHMGEKIGKELLQLKKRWNKKRCVKTYWMWFYALKRKGIITKSLHYVNKKSANQD